LLFRGDGWVGRLKSWCRAAACKQLGALAETLHALKTQQHATGHQRPTSAAGGWCGWSMSRRGRHWHEQRGCRCTFSASEVRGPIT